MKSMFTLAGMALLAGTIAAQTNTIPQKLYVVNEAGIAVKVGKATKEANFKKGQLTKPGMIKALVRTQGGMAMAHTAVWFLKPMHGKAQVGAHLTNSGHVRSGKDAGAANTLSAPKKIGSQQYLWTFMPAKDGKAKVLVHISGSIFGRGFVAFTAGRWGKKFTKGRFQDKTEFSVTLKKGVLFKLPFSMNAACGATKAGANYNGHLSFVMVPDGGTQPGLQWITFGKSCGGAIGCATRPEFGKPVEITLSKATPNTPAFLVLGHSRVRFFMFRLPLDLKRFGAPGCTLYTNIDHLLFAKTNALGVAKAKVMLPKHGAWTRHFKGLYLQWAFQTKKNRMGLLWSNAGGIVPKK